MQGKECGTTRFRKGASSNGYDANDLHLVALACIKYASLMLTNWYTTTRNVDANKIIVESELVEFKHSEAHTNYYYGRHVVDEGNNNRQFSVFRRWFLPNYWNKRKFEHVISTC